MTFERENLKETLQKYISDTCDDIGTVQVFSESCDQWIEAREAEVQALTEAGESEKELGAVLEKTLNGLKDLQRPLEALERLAITSLHVFEKNPNPDMDLKTVRLLIWKAQIVTPLLLLFKQDNDKFFHPNALNKDVYQNKLQNYIVMMRIIFDEWKSGSHNIFDQVQPQIDLQDLSEGDVKKMLSQIRTLGALRTDQAFKMVVLFKGRSQRFREMFCELKPQIEQLLRELEACAHQLDRTYKDCRISGVAASTEGIAAGILAIAGIVLAVPTGGLSLALDFGALGLGVFSGIQGLVTTLVEHGVNKTQSQRAKEAFSQCVTLMNKVQGLLNDVIQQHFEGLKENVLKEVIEAGYGSAVLATDFTGLGSKIYEQVINKRLSPEAIYHVEQGEVAISRLEIRGLRVVKMVNNLARAFNVLSIGADGYFLYQDAEALAHGTETEPSQWIRARTALWGSEVESWQKVHDSLSEGEKDYGKNMEMVEKAFYPQI